MEEQKTTTVEMTEAERLEYQEFQKARARKAAEDRAKRMREDYTRMVDEELAAAIPQLLAISGDIATVKKTVLENFQTILEMKGEMFRNNKGVDMTFKSHTFTDSASTMRITIGQRLSDSYLDTAEDGIEKIREYIQSLATDEKSQALVGMVMKLLSKDSKGTLKAQRIIQLRKIAEETGNAEFIEGVRIIEEAYRPSPTRTFIYAEVRDEATNGWKSIPLGMTES